MALRRLRFRIGEVIDGISPASISNCALLFRSDDEDDGGVVNGIEFDRFGHDGGDGLRE